MRRLMTMVLAGCLVSAGHVPATAQESSDGASFGGYVASPTRGVAISFPEDWLAFDLTGDIEDRARSIEAALGDVFPAGREALVAYLERRRDRSELLALSLAGDSCELGLLTSRHTDLHDPAFIAQIDTALEAELGIEDYTGVTPIEHPVGSAITWSWVQVAADADGVDTPRSAYMIDGGLRGAILNCQGAERPDDDWASIAMTVEFPAVAVSSELVGVGGRVEVEPSGFALTFPADWIWARTSEAETEALVERLSTLADPEFAEERRALLAEAEGISPLIGWPLVGDEHCRVGEVSTLQSLDELVTLLLGHFDEYETAYPDGATNTALEVDGHEFARLDYTQVEPEWPEPRTGSHYMTVADRTYYYIACLGTQAPPDRWLAIIGTFELLSADG